LIVAAVGVAIMAVPAIPPPEARLPQGPIELPHTVEIRQVPAVITYAATRNTAVVLDPRGSYAVTEPQTGPDGTTEVRITRDASTTADDVWWHLVETSRMRTWAELQARLTRGAPASAAVLARATVDRGCDVTQISLGTEVQGELRTTSCRNQNNSGYYDRYVFNATAGQQIIVTARAAFDTALELKKSSGETIQSNDDTENLNPRIEARLEETGDYVIDLRGLSATGKYTLHLVSP